MPATKPKKELFTKKTKERLELQQKKQKERRAMQEYNTNPDNFDVTTSRRKDGSVVKVRTAKNIRHVLRPKPKRKLDPIRQAINNAKKNKQEITMYGYGKKKKAPAPRPKPKPKK